MPYHTNNRKRFFIKASLYTAFILLFCQPLTLSAHLKTDTLYLNTNNAEYPVHKYLTIYKADRNLNPYFVNDTVKKSAFFRLNTGKSFSENITSKYYWLKLDIKNNLPSDQLLYFQFNSQVVDLITGYQRNDAGKFNFIGLSGTDIPFNSRVYTSYDLVYPLDIKAGGATTFLFQLNTDDGNSIHFLPQLRSENLFKAEEERFYLVTGLITGLMLTVFLLNIFLGISLKEKLHLLYALYILIALYEIFSMTGSDIQFIYPGHPLISGYLQDISPCVLGILMTYIMQWFLEQKTENSKFKRFVDIGLWCMIGMIPLNIAIQLLLPNNRIIPAIEEIALAILLMLQCLLFVLSAVEKVFQGNKPARFYLAAVLFFIIGLVEFIWMVLYGNDQELVLKLYPNHVQVGIMIETVVVFLGIVYRYNLFKRQKEELILALNNQQQDLINKIVAAEETERKRIAQDLHDDVGATLGALAMHLTNLPEGFQGISFLNNYVTYAVNLSGKAFADLRAVSHNLLPADISKNGLFVTLEKRIAEFNLGKDTRYVLITEGDETKLSEVLAITIYRIVNELLTNISKHSMASEAAIQLLIEDRAIQVMAEDNGVGFDKSQLFTKGIGLKNIGNRVEFLNGNIYVDSNNNGTQTIIKIPFTYGY